jgi:L-ascorbate metabolism protein UlaG (beta-lactamase superfamily)
MIIFFAVIATLVLLITLYMKQEKFGQIPKGERLERIKNSPNFNSGSFKNLNYTPQMTNESGFWQMIKEYFSAQNKKPLNIIPSVKTNLHNLPADKDVLVWFGHSSYFIQINGKKILVDPVFSGHASPFSFSVKAFKGSDVYAVDDIPEIDFLVITHDHWDHLDYKTVLGLKDKIKNVVSGLGVGSHLERWGFSSSSIIELDWFETKSVAEGFLFHAMPARHFSGRGFIHKKTLWASFLLETHGMKILIGGDSGYDTHFAEIGKKFGSIDLAILENGQYNHSWKYIHMHPHEVLKAAKDANAKRLFPVHSMKFALANHAWDTPLKTITELNKKEGIPLLTPLIGEIVYLNDSTQTFKKWWENMN